jgi:putative alpha-1,2-mannosidase
MVLKLQVEFWKVKSKPKSYGTISYQKIEITESNLDKSYFYTAFYHTMVQPNIAQDLDESTEEETIKFT